MTKLMAFDLDGTILFNRAVDPATEQAIARWQAEGNLAVSCTGKSIFARPPSALITTCCTRVR